MRIRMRIIHSRQLLRPDYETSIRYLCTQEANEPYGKQ